MALVSDESFLASIQFGTIAAVGLLVVTTFMWIKAVRARGRKINLPTYYVPMGSDAATVIKQAHKEVYAQRMPLLTLGKTMKLKLPSQCPETPFVFSQFGMSAVILPTSEIETVKSLPESQLSIKYASMHLFSDSKFELPNMS